MNKARSAQTPTFEPPVTERLGQPGAMKYSLRRALLWLLLYIVLALVPMAIAITGDTPESRGFWIELGVAMGFIGLSTMGLQMIFTGRIRTIAPRFGMDNLMQFHREIGIISFLFVLAHPLILIIANPYFLIYYDPTANFMRAAALSFVTVAVIAIVVSSIWRLTFKLNYEWWRLIHGVLAFLIVLVGITHSIQVGHFFEALWKKVAIAVLFGICAYMVIHTRLVRPWANSKRPYRVESVKEERGNSYTLTLRPDGFQRLPFEPGQFVWITMGEKALTLQQHPFSIASSDQDPNISLTAKVLGDFTATWPDIKKDTPAILEGPFGSFTIKEDDPVFMVMGGIGITPGIGILRSLVDREDERNVILVYANQEWKDVTFREEVDALNRLPHIRVIHVIAEPDDDWEGETGYVNKELLERYIPAEKNEYTYFICGPEPMMDITETAFRELGVDWRRVYSERFEIV